MSLPPGGTDRLRMAIPLDEPMFMPGHHVSAMRALVLGVVKAVSPLRGSSEPRARADVPALSDHATNRAVVRVFLAACPEGDVSEGLRIVWITEVSGQDSHNDDTSKIDLRTMKVNRRLRLVRVKICT